MRFINNFSSRSLMNQEATMSHKNRASLRFVSAIAVVALGASAALVAPAEAASASSASDSASATRLAARGTLSIAVGGAVTRGVPKIVVTGPGGFSRTVSASRTLTGLQPGEYSLRAYSVKVRGGSIVPARKATKVIVGLGRTSNEVAVQYSFVPVPQSSVSLTATPGTPTDVVGVSANTAVRLTWTPPDLGQSAITDYKVEVSRNAGGYSEVSHTASAVPALTVSGLVNGDSYTFRVSAKNVNGYSATPGYSSAVIPNPTVPDAPTGLSPTAGDGQVQLSWNSGADNGSATTDVAIQYTTDGAVWTPFDAVQTASPATVTGLTNGTAYKFRVAQINGIGTGAYSAPTNWVYPAGAPDVPSISAITPGNTIMSLSWSQPALHGGRMTNYTIQYAVDGTSSWQTVNTPSPLLRYDVTGLTNTTSYKFRISATSTGGTSAYSSEIGPFAPIAGAPTAPTNVLGTGVDAAVNRPGLRRPPTVAPRSPDTGFSTPPTESTGRPARTPDQRLRRSE